MTVPRDSDRLIHEFLLKGADELHDQVYDAVRAEIEQRRQRATFGPWRVSDMHKLIPLGIGIAAVVVAVFVGGRLLASPAPGSVGAGSSVQPSAAPSSSPTPSPTASSSPSPTPATPPPLTRTFTSRMHGISVSYPDGWTAQAATKPWTGCLYCAAVHANPQVDVLLHPVHDDGVFLRIASQPIGKTAPKDWVAAQMASDERCTTTEPIIVDGATGLSGGETCHVAVVTIAGRGYHIDLYVSPDNLDLVAQYDRAWFEEVLATVKLHPEDAVDVAPSATP
jgi:hypothetical protein